MWILVHCGTSSGCDPLPDNLDPDPLTLRPKPPREAIPRNLDVFIARFVQLRSKSPNDTRKGEVELGVSIRARSDLVSMRNGLPEKPGVEFKRKGVV